MKHFYSFIAMTIFAIISINPSHSYAAPNFQVLACSNGNVTWLETETDECGRIIEWEYCNCSGDITSGQHHYSDPCPVFTIHDTTVTTVGSTPFVDSVRFTTSGMSGHSWDVLGYKNNILLYDVYDSSGGHYIRTFGGSVAHRNNDFNENSICPGKTNIPSWSETKEIGKVPYADSTSFTKLNESWLVTGYNHGNVVYFVNRNKSGVQITIPSTHGLNFSDKTTLQENYDIHNLEGLTNLGVIQINGKLYVKFSLKNPSKTTVHIYDEIGHLINTYEAGLVESGETTIQLSKPNSISSGVYIIQVTSGNEQKIQKFIMEK